MDGLGNRATEREVSKSWGAKIKRGWRATCSFVYNLPSHIRSNLGITLLLSGVASIYTWEMWTGTSGFDRLFPSRAGWTFILCLGSVTAYLYFHRKAAETIRAAKGVSGVALGISQGMLAVLASMICLYGSFSQVVGDALTVTSSSNMALEDRDSIRDQIRGAERTLRNLSRPTNDQALLEDMQDRLNEARGWKFENLDSTPGGTCYDYSKLAPRMQFLCRDANDIRTEQLENEGQWEAVAQAEQRILDLEEKITHITDTERARHYEGMSRLTGDTISQEDFAVWGLFILTVAIWFLGGFMFDEAMEAKQVADRKRKAAEAAAKAGGTI